VNKLLAFLLVLIAILQYRLWFGDGNLREMRRLQERIVELTEEGEQRLEQLARFLEASHESAARSLREGLAEMFTLQRLKIPPSLHKCLATTNLIESPQGGVQKRTANVTRWRDQDMAERWVASAWLETEKKFLVENMTLQEDSMRERVLTDLEREGIVDSFITPLSGRSPVVDVPIKEAYAPNVFVSVLAVRGRVGPVQTWIADMARKFKLPWQPDGGKATAMAVEILS